MKLIREEIETVDFIVENATVKSNHFTLKEFSFKETSVTEMAECIPWKLFVVK